VFCVLGVCLCVSSHLRVGCHVLRPYPTLPHPAPKPSPSTNPWTSGLGSRLHIRLHSTTNTNDGLDPEVKLAHGRWYTVALVVDRYHAAVYIDGVAQMSYSIYGQIVPAVGNQLWSMSESVWGPNADIDDMRFYKGSRLPMGTTHT
jgi:hypothetical protein